MKWLAVMPVMMLIGGIMLLNGADKAPDDSHKQSNISDVATVAFDTYEASWRKLQGEKATKLRAGEFANEAAAAAWFLQQNGAVLKASFTPVIDAEFQSFGGEQWTAEKEAAVAERYVR